MQPNNSNIKIPNTFGSLKNGRNFSVGSGYKYGMNTQQKDDENFVGAYTAEFWEYDSRLGRRWNIDPISFPWQSIYSCFNNNPVLFWDPNGLFGSLKEAVSYQKEHHIVGKITQGKDGIFSINDSKNKIRYFKDPNLDSKPNVIGRRSDGVYSIAMITPKVVEGDVALNVPSNRPSHLTLKQMEYIRPKMHDELSSYHEQQPRPLKDFYISNKGLLRDEVIKQRRTRGIFGSQPGGPKIRYVQDPINPDAVIDLRHMLIIGKAGPFIGNTIELAQSSAGQASGANFQDYYSNYLGYQFYSIYGKDIEKNPTEFVKYLYNFLSSTGYSRLDTDGSFNFYK